MVSTTPRRAGLLLAGAVAAVLVLAAPAGSAWAAAGAAWQWPLQPRPAVLAGFLAPAGPYASGHRGADLAATGGTLVRAAGPGIVAFAGRVAGRGVVSVDHADGLRTTYEPVAAVVARGDLVRAGQSLGLLEGVGSHCPPGTCLHWGLRRGSSYLDPLGLLGALRVRLLPVWSAGTPADPAGPVTHRSPAAVSRGAPDRPVDQDGSRALAVTGAAAVALLAVGLARRRAPP